MESKNVVVDHHLPWNNSKLTGQKLQLKFRDIWAVWTRLQMTSNMRELAMLNLAIDTSFERAILRNCQYKTSPTGVTWPSGPQSCSRSPIGRSNSRSWSMTHENLEALRERTFVKG